MKIAIIGATGFIGAALLDEALARGHVVTALVSRPERLLSRPNLSVAGVDVADTAALSRAVAGHEAVVSAFSGHANADVYGYYVAGFRSILEATRRAGLRRLLLVGGAGSLEIGRGIQLVDTPDFPEQWKASALGAREALRILRAEADDLDWTMLSPPALVTPGERTGTFRVGTDTLLVGSDAKSAISTSDYAIAMMDELEHPKHARARFTVGY